MKPNSREKKFDAVEMMRKIRNKLSRRYLKNPELEEKDLEQMRKKYGIQTREKV